MAGKSSSGDLQTQRPLKSTWTCRLAAGAKAPCGGLSRRPPVSSCSACNKLRRCTQAGRAQNRRLAACLRAAAATTTDAAGKSGIDATKLGAGGVHRSPTCRRLRPPLTRSAACPGCSNRLAEPNRIPVIRHGLGGGRQGDQRRRPRGLDDRVRRENDRSGSGTGRTEQQVQYVRRQWEGDAAKPQKMRSGLFDLVDGDDRGKQPGRPGHRTSRPWRQAGSTPACRTMADYENASVLATVGQAAYDFFTGHATKQQRPWH